MRDRLRPIGLAALGVLAWGWLALWLQHLPFFTDDYDRWILQAHDASWGKAILDVLNPWGGFDETWGFAHRPLEVVWFKLFALGGTSAALIFQAKILATVLLVVLASAAVLRVTGSWFVTLLCPVLVLTSHGVLASLSWAGDMAVLSDLLILSSIVLFAWILAQDRPPVIALALAALLPLLAFQTKPNGKLLCGIYLAGILWARGATLRRALLPTVAIQLFALPLAALLRKLPLPWNSRTPTPNYIWHAPALWQSKNFLYADAWEAYQHPQDLTLSLGADLWPLGWIVVALLVPAILWAIVRWLRAGPETRAPDRWSAHFTRMILVWMLLAWAATASYPGINRFFQYRYLIDTLVPTSIVLTLAAGWIAGRFGTIGRVVITAGLLCTASYQARWGAARMLHFRQAFADMSNTVDTLNHEMARHTDATQRGYLEGFLAYNFWPPLPGRERMIARAEDLRSLPERSYVFSWSLPLIEDYEVVAHSRGRNGSYLERYYDGFERGGYLLRRAPASLTRTNGRIAARAGDWATAVPLLLQAIGEHDTVLERSLAGEGLVRLGRFAEAATVLKPVVALDPTGLRPVRYNLALALLNSAQYDEAIAMYEYLIREVPSDIDSTYNLGVAYRSAGRKAEARRAFQLVLAKRPDYQSAHLNLQELGDAK